MAIMFPFLGGRPCGQITVPLVYDESLSIAQQIACIMGRLRNIDADFVSVEDFEKFVGAVNVDQEKQTADLMDYTDAEIAKLDDELRKLIVGMQIGYMVWDVTEGRYADSVAAMRNLFNDITVHAITVDTLAGLDLDVDGLADCGLNVRGLAVFSGYLIGDGFTPEGIMYEGADVDIPLTTEILANGMVRDGYFVMGKGDEDGE